MGRREASRIERYCRIGYGLDSLTITIATDRSRRALTVRSDMIAYLLGTLLIPSGRSECHRCRYQTAVYVCPRRELHTRGSDIIPYLFSHRKEQEQEQARPTDNVHDETLEQACGEKDMQVR